MNSTILMGRLTKDPTITYTTDNKAVAKFTLAVDRIGEGADFISCVAFGKTAEIVEKYITKGTKILLNGRIQTGSYTNKDNVKVYTTDVIANNIEFCESKKEQENTTDSFIDIAEVDEEGLPF